MNGEYSIALPYPPNGNHQYTIARGRKILSDKARQWAEDAQARVSAAGMARDTEYLQVGGKGETVIGSSPVSVRVKYRKPDNRKRDVHGMHKLVLDVLTQCGFWDDDDQVVRFTAEWDDEVPVTPIIYKKKRSQRRDPLPVNGGCMVIVSPYT